MVIFGLLNDKQPAVPKGLPAPPKETTYLVLVAKKPCDALIIEGYPAYKPGHAGITVSALSVTTKQQAAKRAVQRAESG